MIKVVTEVKGLGTIKGHLRFKTVTYQNVPIFLFCGNVLFLSQDI